MAILLDSHPKVGKVVGELIDSATSAGVPLTEFSLRRILKHDAKLGLQIGRNDNGVSQYISPASLGFRRLAPAERAVRTYLEETIGMKRVREK